MSSTCLRSHVSCATPGHKAGVDHRPLLAATPPVQPYIPPEPKMRQRRSTMRANYHPFLFTLMTLTATAELGLTAFLISAGNEAQTWASPRYHSLSVPRRSKCHPHLTESRSSLILLCFSSAWTLLFSGAYVLWLVDGAVHLLAQVASSVVWLLLAAILWVRLLASKAFQSSRMAR